MNCTTNVNWVTGGTHGEPEHCIFGLISKMVIFYWMIHKHQNYVMIIIGLNHN